LTDVKGVLDDKGCLIDSMDDRRAGDLIERGVIDKGMYPKVKCCLKALKNGVKKAHIIDGRLNHSILLEILTDRGIGTEVITGESRESAAHDN
jgi:acetylglutamate kinase